MSLVRGKTELFLLVVSCSAILTGILYGIIINRHPPEPPSQTIGEELSELEVKVYLLELERTALLGAIRAQQEQNTLMKQDLDACQLAASRTTGTELLP